MPAAIVMINTLRQRVLPLHTLGWVALALVALFGVVALICPKLTVPYLDLAMVMIILSASLSHTLFMALSPVRLADSFRLLRFDILIFILIIAVFLWKKFP
jgi:hypothetical protein